MTYHKYASVSAGIAGNDTSHNAHHCKFATNTSKINGQEDDYHEIKIKSPLMQNKQVIDFLLQKSSLVLHCVF